MDLTTYWTLTFNKDSSIIYHSYVYLGPCPVIFLRDSSHSMYLNGTELRLSYDTYFFPLLMPLCYLYYRFMLLIFIDYLKVSS